MAEFENSRGDADGGREGLDNRVSNISVGIDVFLSSVQGKANESERGIQRARETGSLPIQLPQHALLGHHLPRLQARVACNRWGCRANKVSKMSATIGVPPGG